METSMMGKPKKTLLGPRSRTLSLYVFFALLMAVVSLLPFGQTLENRSLDLFSACGPRYLNRFLAKTPPPPIGRLSPWSSPFNNPCFATT